MDIKLFAKHLKTPEGEIGRKVGIIMNEINAFITKFTYQKMEVSGNEKILEIGFGNGKFIPYLFELCPDISYYGIELSHIMVEDAIFYNSKLIESKKITIEQGDSLNLNFGNNFFDKICSVNTVYFWVDPIKYLTEIWRVLKPGGEVYVSFRSKATLQKDNLPGNYFSLYEVEEIYSFAKKAGFSSINHWYILEEGGQADVTCVKAIKQD